MSGIVYILTNPAMPGLVKIGKTSRDNPEARISELYTTGVPVPFECVKAVKVENEDAIEVALHIAFGPYRINSKREFFQIDEIQALVLLEQLGSEDVTPQINADNEQQVDEQSREAGKRLSQRRPSLNFEEMSIPVGSILTAVKGDDTVEIIGPKKVRFRGEETSLTAATKIVLDANYSPRPGPHWYFQGKLLADIYDQTYEHPG